MSYDVSSIPLFDKQAKRLAKKYPSLKEELDKFLTSIYDKSEKDAISELELKQIFSLIP